MVGNVYTLQLWLKLVLNLNCDTWLGAVLKTTMRDHLTPARMAIVNKLQTSAGKGVE